MRQGLVTVLCLLLLATALPAAGGVYGGDGRYRLRSAGTGSHIRANPGPHALHYPSYHGHGGHNVVNPARRLTVEQQERLNSEVKIRAITARAHRTAPCGYGHSYYAPSGEVHSGRPRLCPSWE